MQLQLFFVQLFVWQANNAAFILAEWKKHSPFYYKLGEFIHYSKMVIPIASPIATIDNWKCSLQYIIYFMV